MATASDIELAILNSAQEFVDDWHRDLKRGPFLRAVRVAANAWMLRSAYQAEHRFAFIRVANAIRVGRGHATTRPDPLLDIVRFSLLDYGSDGK
jgi:hypothetical protein